MKHIAKRSFSLLLVLAMVASLFAGLSLTAYAAGSTIASWTNAKWSANTAYPATNGTGSLKSEVGITSAGSGSAAGYYYASNWTAGKSVIISGLSMSNYTGIQLDCRIRASAKGTLTVSTSADGTNYTQLTTKSTSSSSTPTAVSITGIPASATCIKLSYGSTGSFFFGDLVISGTAKGPVTPPSSEATEPTEPEPTQPVPEGSYQLVSKIADLTAGEYAILTNNKAASFNGTVSGGHLQTASGWTWSSGVSTANPQAVTIVTFEAVSGKENTYKLKVGNKYLTSSKAGSGGFVLADSDDYGWTFANGRTALKACYQKSDAAAGIWSYNNSSLRSYAYNGDNYQGGSYDIYLAMASREEPAPDCEHTNVDDVAETPAGCLTTGLTAGRYCRDCEMWIEGHEEIAALGHAWNEGTVTTPATATEPGEMLYTCTRCSATKREVIAPTDKVAYNRATEIVSGDEYILVVKYSNKYYAVNGFASKALTVSEVEITNNAIIMERSDAYLIKIETVSGGYSLKADGKYISAASGDTAISQASTATAWTAAAGSAEDTFRFSVGTSRALGMNSAGGGLKHYALSNTTGYEFDCYLFSNSCAHNHTELRNVVVADCSTNTNGYSGDLVCLDCGATLEPGHTISGAHVYVVDHSDPATCTTPGTAYEVCSGCGKTRETEIAALGHDYAQSAHADATCTEDGYTTYTCSHDASHTYTDTIPALGHHYDSETGICDRCHDQLASYTVSFVVPNGINPIDPITAFDGTKIQLPEPSGTLAANAEEYIFAGWTTANVTDSTDAEFLDAGEYTVTGDITLKALYAWVGSESFGGDSLYKLMTESDLASLDTGWMLIIANDGKWDHKTMALADYTSGGNEKFAGRTVTVTNNTIKISATSDVQQFTVVKDADSGYFYLISNYTDNEDTYYYLTSCTNTANANNITLTSNPTAAALWSISYHDDGTVKLTAQGSWTANTVQFNSSNYNGFFSCYGETYYGSETMPSNIYGIRLFASNAIFHFTTEPVQTCEHENVTWTDNEDGTCTGICDDCGHTVGDHQTHAWTLDEDAEGTVAATCTASGKAGYVCSNCSATKLEDTEALGHDYAGTETTAPTCSAAGVMTYTCSRCEDSYEEEIPAVSHSFVNGTCTMCGASLYVLVTEAPANWEGEYLIAYVNGENAKVFDGKNDAAANYTIGTFYGPEGSESSLICVPNPDDYMVMFDPNGSGYRIMNSDANWWSYTQASNGFSTNSSTSFAGTYNISLDASGNAIIKNAGNYSIKFNNGAAASGGDRFRFYGTSIYTTIKLYEKYDTCHHDWVLDVDASTPATCGKAGTNVYECSICHETKNETVPALQHDYYYNDVPATCTEEGYTECYCHNCDYAEILGYTIVEPLGHDFSIEPDPTDEDHYIAPTATEEGLMYCQCSRCGEWDTEGEIIPALGVVSSKTYTKLTAEDFDSYDSALADVEQFIIVAEADGKYYALSANGNGTVLNAVEIPVSGTTATVSSDSTVAALIPDYAAKNYDETQTGLGFQLVDGTYLHLNSSKMNFNTTAENGLFTVSKAYTNDTFCLIANGKYIVFDAEEEVFTMGTSKTNAAKLYIFTANALDITYNGAVVTALTLAPDAEGILGYVFNQNPANVIAEWSSDNEDVISVDYESGEFLTGEAGTATVTLNLYTYSEDWTTYHLYTAALPVTVSGDTPIVPEVKIDSAALRLGENIDLLYTASVPAAATNVYMTFTMNGETATVSADANGIFAFDDINPQCMGDNIAAVLHATVNGKEYTDELLEYSVRQYCVNMLGKTEDTKLISLLSDTLAYGAAAQTYMNYKTNALVTSGVTGTSYSTFSPLSGLAPTFTGTAVESPCWIGAGLVLTNNVEMVFRFASPNKSGLSVKVTYNGKTTTFSGTSITAVSGMSGVYEVKLTGIKATDFGQTVTAKFYKSGAQVGDTLGYSVNTYICAKQADSDANLAALVKALYNYGAAAAAYAG